ncbi:hypothetical protein HZS_4272 [Henneguya salminicola]|nr:hypothetical protein HZS_4272 [Henneguya salminicola]
MVYFNISHLASLDIRLPSIKYRYRQRALRASILKRTAYLTRLHPIYIRLANDRYLNPYRFYTSIFIDLYSHSIAIDLKIAARWFKNLKTLNCFEADEM